MLNADTNLIGTMQEFKEAMYGYISDASKDAQGFRTRFDYTEYTAEELMKEAVYWEGRVIESIEEDRIREAECVAEFEKLIADTISMGAGDRETAIRWLRSSDEWAENDDNYFEYTYGLPYGYLSGKINAFLA
jgi:hypothetical protein